MPLSTGRCDAGNGVMAGRPPVDAQRRQARGPDGSSNAGPWGRLSVTGIEADLAYFQARIELIGEPSTINQKAQLAAFRFLTHAVGRVLNRLKRKAPAPR
jgi:hypothetical protein